MIKKIITLVSVASLLGSGMAFAASSSTMKGGLGFHTLGSVFDPLFAGIFGTTSAAPTLGVREWFTNKVGGDIGFGYTNLKDEPGGGGTTTISGWSIDVGVPIVLKSWEKVNFMVRPGVAFGSLKDEPPAPQPSTTLTTMAVSGELEVEWMVTDNVSISASHGLAYNSIHDDANPENKLTSISTTGNNFTQLGFHVYLW